MNNPTVFLDRCPDIKVSLSKLIREYRQIEDKMQVVTNHNNKSLVQRKFHILKYDKWCEEKDLFKYTLEIADQIKKIYTYNSITYRMVNPNTAYNWHTDKGQICYHIPLITNPGCWFVYEYRSFAMPADGSVYVVNNGRPHTFANAGPEPRVHLIFEMLYHGES